jgi:uncharacterized protein (TIGR02117 family)
MKRFLILTLASVVTVVGGYCAYAVAAALLQVSARQQDIKVGDPAVYVCDSFVHTDIVLQMRDADADLAKVFGFEAWQGLAANQQVAIGWGDFRFFTEVPTFRDITPGVLFSVLTGQNPTALRVGPTAVNETTEGCVRVPADAAARKALYQHVAETLKRDAADEPVVLKQAAADEIYFDAKGTYSPFRTCNQWTADGLAAAGLRHSRFSPFSINVMWPLQ